MRIGLIQSCSIGDLIIALPIAQWYLDRGHEVIWPIDAKTAAFMQAAAPTVKFLPVDPALAETGFANYALHAPLKMLLEAKCDHIFPLYNYVKGQESAEPRLAGSLKFDEYKYAVARVPFVEKWNLRLARDPEREAALAARLDLSRPYVCLHLMGGGSATTLEIPPAWRDEFNLVNIEELTDNPFDWIGVIEGAAKRVMTDSCFANLTDQLNIGGENYLCLRSPVASTPVFRNGWIFS